MAVASVPLVRQLIRLPAPYPPPPIQPTPHPAYFVQYKLYVTVCTPAHNLLSPLIFMIFFNQPQSEPPNKLKTDQLRQLIVTEWVCLKLCALPSVFALLSHIQ